MANVNIKPISDLNRYSDVLKEVAVGSPVYLTKNGYGKYVIFDIEDPLVEFAGNIVVSDELIEEVRKAHEKADQEGWLSLDDVKEVLKKRNK